MTDQKNVEQRRAPRYSVFDAVQYTEVQSETRINARITNLSLTGCYIDTKNPLPPGTQIKLKLILGDSSFETPATVVRSEPNTGMGVMFHPPS